MSPQTPENSPKNYGDKIVMAWTVHLMRQEPQKLAVIIPLVVAACSSAFYMAGPLGTIVTCFVLMASLADYMFPVHYEITSEHATCKRLTGFSEIKWENVKRYYLDDLGIKLSPLKYATRLEAYRGVYLRFGNNKDQVIEAVKSLRGDE